MTPFLIFIGIPPIYAVPNEANNILASSVSGSLTHWFKNEFAKDIKLENAFEVTIIPHTLERTIMDSYQIGSKVNIEYDMLARYVQSMTSRK